MKKDNIGLQLVDRFVIGTASSVAAMSIVEVGKEGIKSIRVWSRKYKRRKRK